MYSVTAPAFDCDIQSGDRSDNANKLQSSDKPTSVMKVSSLKDYPPTVTSLDPSEIAAKILQMHAADEEKTSSQSRQPRLVETDEDTGFEMPGVLLRPHNEPYSFNPEPKPNETGRRWDAPDLHERKAPSFKVLALGTLLMAGAGVTYSLLGMPGLTPPEQPAGRLVQTELITPAPTIESLIAEDALNQGEKEVPAASAEQVAVAKQRIRNAFAAGNTGQPAAPALQEASTTAPEVVVAEPKASSSAGGGLKQTTSRSPHPDTRPLFTSTAERLPLPGRLATRDTPASQPVVDQDISATTAVEPQLDQSATAKGVTDPIYAQAGTITASVNLRASEDKDAEILAVIPEGSKVGYDECGTWWCGVTYDGKTGFVGQKYLERPVQ